MKRPQHVEQALLLSCDSLSVEDIMLTNLWRRLVSPKVTKASRRGRFRPQVECLEDRCLMSVVPIVEYRLPQDYGGQPVPLDLAAGTLHNHPVVWFSEEGHFFGSIDLVTGQVTDNHSTQSWDADPTGTLDPQSLVTGPDGSLWMSGDWNYGLSFGTKIYQYSNGLIDVNRFEVVGSGRDVPMTAGPAGDNGVWYVGNNALERIDASSGAVTSYPVPAAYGVTDVALFWGNSDYVPRHGVPIATGRDGDIWYATGNLIAKLNPSTEAVTEYQVAGGGPITRLAAWGDRIAYLSGNSIGWVSLDGMTSQALNGGLEPWDLTAGPDGNIWFTDIAGSAIGRLTPDGTVTFFATPTANSQPLGITAGADGNIWFAESAAGQLGKIDLQVLRAPVVSLTVNPGAAVVGQPVVLTASVSPVLPSYGSPTGSITFYRDLYIPLGTVALDGNGQASFSITTLPQGVRSVFAVYNPDNAQFVPAASQIIQETVISNTTTTTFDLNPFPTALGQPFQVLVKVVANDPHVGALTGPAIVPGGSVSVSIDGTDVSPGVALDALGQASVPVKGFDVWGDHHLQVSYHGDQFFAPSDAPPLALNIYPDSKRNRQTDGRGSPNMGLPFDPRVTVADDFNRLAIGPRTRVESVLHGPPLPLQVHSSSYGQAARVLGNHTVQATSLVDSALGATVPAAFPAATISSPTGASAGWIAASMPAKSPREIETANALDAALISLSGDVQTFHPAPAAMQDWFLKLGPIPGEHCHGRDADDFLEYRDTHGLATNAAEHPSSTPRDGAHMVGGNAQELSSKAHVVGHPGRPEDHCLMEAVAHCNPSNTAPQ
jgi:streptogramin lyase